MDVIHVVDVVLTTEQDLETDADLEHHGHQTDVSTDHVTVIVTAMTVDADAIQDAAVMIADADVTTDADATAANYCQYYKLR